MLFACPSDYLKPVTPEAVAAHRRWLDEALQSGQLVSAGRRADGGGGVVILRAADPAAARAILDNDPFTAEGFARYDCIGFTPSFGALEG